MLVPWALGGRNSTVSSLWVIDDTCIDYSLTVSIKYIFDCLEAHDGRSERQLEEVKIQLIGMSSDASSSRWARVGKQISEWTSAIPSKYTLNYIYTTHYQNI